MYNDKFKGLQGEPSNDDIMELVLAIINNVMRNLHVASLAVVDEIDGNSYIVRPFPIVEGETEKKITCIKVNGLALNVNDVAVILYMDRDYRQNLSQHQNNQSLTATTNQELHQEKFGIIINKL